MKLRRCTVYFADDGDGHSDEMDRYDDRGKYYYADDVDPMIARLRAALRSAPCPRPANGRPDDFTVGECCDVPECGCTYGIALGQAAP